MSNVSLLTIAKGRQQHLHRLLRGVAEQHSRPREVIIVFINEPIPDRMPDPGCPVHPIELTKADHELPLAAARNLAASRAAGDVLAFLDADCIPGDEYLDRLEHAVNLTHGLVMADVRYLSSPPDSNWTYPGLEQRSVPHPDLPPVPVDHGLVSLDHGLFGAAAFGIRTRDFARLGGFDESFRGYGAEDTDLAFVARRTRLPAYLCNARAFHQPQVTHRPPYDRLEAIVGNAARFHEKWRIWPMKNWLQQFHKAGLIEWSSDRISVVSLPDRQLLDESRTDAPFG